MGMYAYAGSDSADGDVRPTGMLTKNSDHLSIRGVCDGGVPRGLHWPLQLDDVGSTTYLEIPAGDEYLLFRTTPLGARQDMAIRGKNEYPVPRRHPLWEFEGLKSLEGY